MTGEPPRVRAGRYHEQGHVDTPRPGAIDTPTPEAGVVTTNPVVPLPASEAAAQRRFESGAPGRVVRETVA